MIKNDLAAQNRGERGLAVIVMGDLQTCLWAFLIRKAAACLIGICFLAGSLPGGGTFAFGQVFSPVAEWTDDSRINDIFFVDPDLGWAVGDRGTILRTVDGGRNWELVRSPVYCSLEGVFFLNERMGWAVGGYSKPVINQSKGVVLRTVDGGATWSRIDRRAIPWFKQISMQSESAGWAFGHVSPSFPTGVMYTRDGGQSWYSHTGKLEGAENVAGDWTAASSWGRGQVAVVGRDGKAAYSSNQALENATFLCRRIGDLSGLAMVDGKHGWAVGPEGMVLFTRTGGKTWQDPPIAMPQQVTREFDWESVAVHGDRIWMAGNPGSSILRSTDQGATWTLHATGSPMPVRRLFFFDANRGWAVGEGGTILNTRDGGQTWRLQRQGCGRVAMMGIVANPAQASLDLTTRLSGADGYQSVWCWLDTPTSRRTNSTQAPYRDRIQQAYNECGATSVLPCLITSQVGSLQQARRLDGPGSANLRGQEFTVQQADFLQGGGTRSSLDGTGRPVSPAQATGYAGEESHHLERLVRMIRTWRPNVVVTDLSEDSEFHHLDPELLGHAIDLAADHRSFSEQITIAGLSPWQVDKLYLETNEAESGRTLQSDIRLPLSQMAPMLGTSIEDHSFTARGLVADSHIAEIRQPGWDLIKSSLASGFEAQNWWSGIERSKLTEATRPQRNTPPGNLHAMRRQAQKWELFERIATTVSQHPNDGELWGQQVEGLLLGMSEQSSGNLLFQLASLHQQRNQHEAAARAMHWLVTDHAQHPFWDSAMVWLIRYYASNEATWHHNSASQELLVAVDQFDPISEMDLSDIDALMGTNSERVRNEVDPVSTPYSAENAKRVNRFGDIPAARRGSHARKLLEALREVEPDLMDRPDLQFAIAGLDRVFRGEQQASAMVLKTSEGFGPSWLQAGQLERWLMDPSIAPPVPVVLVSTAPSAPFLDGELNDQVWQQSPTIQLAALATDSLSKGPSAPQQNQLAPNLEDQVQVSFDEQFLYIAVRVLNSQANLEEGDFARDRNLNSFERLRLELDIDRDYQSRFVFEWDPNGRTRDEAHGNPAWNPQWFQASKFEKQTWVTEVAIPFSQLGMTTPHDRHAWGLSLQRMSSGQASPETREFEWNIATISPLLLFSK